MVTRVSTVAFEGIEARAVDVQVQITPGNVAFMVVGLPDKAVGESRERVRAALIASGLALPSKRITVNLAPADPAVLILVDGGEAEGPHRLGKGLGGYSWPVGSDSRSGWKCSTAC